MIDLHVHPHRSTLIFNLRVALVKKMGFINFFFAVVWLIF